MSTVASLLVRIRGDSEALRKDLDSTSKRLKTMGKNVSQTGKTMTKWVTGSMVAAGTGLFALAQTTANAGDEIQKMALRTGFSTEALSEFKHAAELSGTSIDSMEKGVKRMQKVLFDASKGLASSNDALEALNLSFDALDGLKPEEQFSLLSTALADVEDESRRAALAQEIFGRAGTEMLPMLAQGSEGIAAMRKEAHDLGIVFDQEAADAAAKFNDDLLRVKKAAGGAFQELGMKLIPIMVDEFIPALQEHVIPLVHKFAEGIINLINWFKSLDPMWKKVIGIAGTFLLAIGPILMVVGKFITLIGVLTPLLGTLKAGLLLLTGPVGIVIAAVVGLILIWRKWGDSIKVIVKNVINIFKRIPSMIKSALSGVVNAITSPFRAAQRRISGIMDNARAALNKLNPFARSSPSLVDNVKKGMGVIKNEIEGMSVGMNIQPVAAMAGGSMTIRHEVDLVNVPPSVDQGSLEARLESMLNNPSIKRRLDRIGYENRRDNERGMGR